MPPLLSYRSLMFLTWFTVSGRSPVLGFSLPWPALHLFVSGIRPLSPWVCAAGRCRNQNVYMQAEKSVRGAGAPADGWLTVCIFKGGIFLGSKSPAPVLVLGVNWPGALPSGVGCREANHVLKTL